MRHRADYCFSLVALGSREDSTHEEEPLFPFLRHCVSRRADLYGALRFVAHISGLVHGHSSPLRCLAGRSCLLCFPLAPRGFTCLCGIVAPQITSEGEGVGPIILACSNLIADGPGAVGDDAAAPTELAAEWLVPESGPGTENQSLSRRHRGTEIPDSEPPCLGASVREEFNPGASLRGTPLPHPALKLILLANCS